MKKLYLRMQDRNETQELSIYLLDALTAYSKRHPITAVDMLMGIMTALSATVCTFDKHELFGAYPNREMREEAAQLVAKMIREVIT